MHSEIVDKAQKHVETLLKKGLSPDHKYHNAAHTMAVKEAALNLAERYRMAKEEKELLALAALFHDTGFTHGYENHEDQSKEIASEFLQKTGFDKEKIRRINALIEVTRVDAEPTTLLEKVMKDADFNTYSGHYLERSEALRHEWKVFRGIDMSEQEWVKSNLDFWNNHQFYTGEALAMFGEEKRKTKKELKNKKQAQDEAVANDNVLKKELDFAISKSKSAQMMFKTTLRNQIDLTNIADNKANIMLSINSLLITLGIPLLLPKLLQEPVLAIPAGCLLLTSVLSIIFATLATRPVKMTGITEQDQIDTGRSNLFFFGNFYRMDMKSYSKALHKVLVDASLLDHSIVNDLYFLGRTLGNKYRRLRITYNIFMFGMVCTVIAFALVLLLS